jgi:hypothetical protein
MPRPAPVMNHTFCALMSLTSSRSAVLPVWSPRVANSSVSGWKQAMAARDRLA